MGNNIGERSIEHLKALLAINTTNPPGNEEEAVNYIASAVRQCGIEPVITTLDPRRANCVVRLKGSGEKSAVLLNAHLDVVPAGNEIHWRHPPFGAHEEDGFIWGRGAVDMKHMAAMMMAVFEKIVEKKEKIKGDIVFTWTADEEKGGRCGAQHLVENYPDLLEADFGVGEVGGFPVKVGREKFVVVQTAEKGICWFKMKVRGPSGHGSMPDPNSSVVKLSKAVSRLGTTRLPVHMTASTDVFIRKIFNEMIPEPFGEVGEIIVSPQIISRLVRLMPHSPIIKGLWPMMANTVSPTMLKAGESPNVIPEEAEAVMDGRILPGQSTESFLNEIRSIVGEDIEVEIIQEAGSLEVSHDTEFFRHIEACVKKFQPSLKTVPYLNPGFTDGKWFSKLGLLWYGFTPLIATSEQSYNVFELVHATNERVPVEAVKGGADILYDLIEKWLF